MAYAIHINDADNVVVLVEHVKAGGTVTIKGKGDSFTAREDIAQGHKMAITTLKKGEEVIKFGIEIGPMMADAVVGDLISEHNLLNDAIKKGEEARQRVREGGKKIMAYPRADGRFGIRNYVMVISTSPECNNVAEAISDATGCLWMCCDRPHLDNGRVSSYTRLALGYTGCSPNIHSALVLKADGEKLVADFVYDLIKKTGKSVGYLDVTAAGDSSVSEGTAFIAECISYAAAQKREQCSIEGLTISMANSGSDWTTALFGNPVIGEAVDRLINDGGSAILMVPGEVASGLEDITSKKFAKRKDALKFLSFAEYTRELIYKETGQQVEAIQPHRVNIQEGITTLIEKSYQAIRSKGSHLIQGILDYCEQPPYNGLWLSMFDNVLPPTLASYASLQGSHMYVHTISSGAIYYELPHLVGVRMSGNENTYNTPEYNMDFNAFQAFSDGVPATGEKFYQLLLDAAEGKVDTKSEINKHKVFHMWYYVDIEFYVGSDPSKVVPYSNRMDDEDKKSGDMKRGYAKAMKAYTERVK